MKDKISILFTTLLISACGIVFNTDIDQLLNKIQILEAEKARIENQIIKSEENQDRLFNKLTEVELDLQEAYSELDNQEAKTSFEVNNE